MTTNQLARHQEPITFCCEIAKLSEIGAAGGVALGVGCSAATNSQLDQPSIFRTRGPVLARGPRCWNHAVSNHCHWPLVVLKNKHGR